MLLKHLCRLERWLIELACSSRCHGRHAVQVVLITVDGGFGI